jgi:hypothetical protein
MITLIHYFRWMLIVALLMITNTVYASIAGSFGFDALGVGAPSDPFFLDTGEMVKIKQNGTGADAYWTLTGMGATTSFWGSDANYDLGKDKVRYQANFDAVGHLITSVGSKTLTNYLEIRGSLPAGAFGGTSWGPVSNQLLLSADLTDVGTSGPFALGFRTVFTGGWAANNPGQTGGSTGENLWLYGLSSGFHTLVSAFESGNLSALSKSMTIKGVASVASVPLPGAVWMFGAGLIALFANRRKSTVGSPRLAV